MSEETKLIKGPGVLLATSLKRYSNMGKRECLDAANAASELAIGYQRNGAACPARDAIRAAVSLDRLSEEEMIDVLLDFGTAIHARAQQLAMQGRDSLLNDAQCQVWAYSGLPTLNDKEIS
jgi:hypothetical protein